MTRVRRLLLLVASVVALPLTVVKGEITLNEAQCETGGNGQTTCCIQLNAACDTLIGYYDKGCAGKCGEACP